MTLTKAPSSSLLSKTTRTETLPSLTQRMSPPSLWRPSPRALCTTSCKLVQEAEAMPLPTLMLKLKPNPRPSLSVKTPSGLLAR